MTTLAANESSVQHAKAGSVTVKIYRGQNRGRTMFTVAWMVGERRFRRNFAEEKRAARFAKTQAKELSAGRVDASCISTTEAAEFREAQRRLREKAPLCVAAGEYASALETLGDGAQPFAWKQNALRHSYASYRLAITNDAAQVALELGNSPQKLFTNYRKVVTRSQAIAWFNVMPTTASNVVPIKFAAS